MKEKNFLHLFDWLLWTFILILPLIAKTGFIADFIATMQDLIPGIENSFLMSNLQDIFAFLGISASANVYYLICWFVIVELTHLTIDILLFIPRYFHKILDGGLKNEK